MSYRFPLATTTWGEEELAAMQRVIASGRFTMGESVQRFEQDFAAFIGSRYAVMVNSGSSANLLMTAALCHSTNPALRLERGDEPGSKRHQECEVVRHRGQRCGTDQRRPKPGNRRADGHHFRLPQSVRCARAKPLRRVDRRRVLQCR